MAGRTDGQTDGQIPPVFYRTSSPSGPLPKRTKWTKKVTVKTQIRFQQNLKQRRIVAKALDGQRYPLPLCECMWMCDGERGSGPEGADDLCSVSLEAIGQDSSLNAAI